MEITMQGISKAFGSNEVLRGLISHCIPGKSTR